MWQDEFLEHLGGATITADAIERAQALKDKNLPAKIYKFRGINKYSVSNFESDTVWVCSADKYNDPYECATTWSSEELLKQQGKTHIDQIVERVNLEKHLSKEQIGAAKASDDPMREIGRLLIGTRYGRSDQEREEMLNAFLSAASQYSRETMVPRMTALTQRGMKICSFTARVDSVVMWGHYGDSHKGFAMEYDVTQWPPDDPRRRSLNPVFYKQTLFDSTKYHLQARTGKGFNNLFGMLATLHKSPDWSYEDEWRFVLPMGESYPDQNYPMPKPSAIYLGSKIAVEDAATLAAIAKKKTIPVYKMALSTVEFKLTPVQFQSP